MNNSINSDLAKERHSNLDVEKLKSFLGELLFDQPGQYENMKNIRKELISRIKPLFAENFYNLNRDEKYQIVMKKSLELCEYAEEKKMTLAELQHLYTMGSILGPEKFLFGLHASAFEFSIELWGTENQVKHWKNLISNEKIFGTYVQTELGHGTYVRGLETTATFDKIRKEFIINSPTLTSIKFWPGSAGKTCNHAIVMAQLLIDGKDHGIQAFVIQLRSLENHRSLPGIELGDIGTKFGFESHDNGYVKFNNVRIPLGNMLMKNAIVTEDGKFERRGNELIMYACMLILRGMLSLIGSLYMSMSTTIAIRYSCVRRQTANLEGQEPQIIDYQTQQYRLFPALASTYAHLFASKFLNKYLVSCRNSTDNFNNIKSTELAKLHAVSSSLKAITFNNALKFTQSNRLCCGGHGYSASSGLSQLISETDAGCTYEGDNVVLYLQTARYLLKSAQKNENPHFEVSNHLKSLDLYKKNEEYFNIFNKLYEESLGEITNRIVYLINEKGFTQFQAWNESSVLLINASKIYITLYILNCFLHGINSHKVNANQQALVELFEFYSLYEICDTNATQILRFNVIDSNKMTIMNEKLYALLPKIRKNAVLLVDAFDWLDSNLCSALGSYDGQAYKRLYEFALNSKFNENDVHQAYYNHLRPYILKNKRISKL